MRGRQKPGQMHVMIVLMEADDETTAAWIAREMQHSMPVFGTLYARDVVPILQQLAEMDVAMAIRRGGTYWWRLTPRADFSGIFAT
jgi:type II secretory ATPase GspE/PulE/Tfp pilus assembly ATPase PilB-like protein